MGTSPRARIAKALFGPALWGCACLILAGCGVNLHQAAASGALEETLALIRNGADLNAPDRDRLTPLHWAAALGRPEAVRALIQAGADVNARDQGGGTPLDYAVYFYEWGSLKGRTPKGRGARAAGVPHPMPPDEDRDRRELIRLLRDAGAKMSLPDP